MSPVNSESYRQARDNAVNDLAEAVNQVKGIEKRIARLKQTIASLDALIEGEEPVAKLNQNRQNNLRQACREALKIANGPRTAKEVRDWLASSGYELSDQRNALASIHTVLKRLVKAKEAIAVTTKDGKTTYEWMGERGDALTTAIQQANYQTAKQVSDAFRSIMGSPATIQQVRFVSEQVERAVAQLTATQAQKEKTQRILDQAGNTRKLLDRVNKKS
jgi:predicted transcriptional regulator